jgi:pSer/pThr/pTyr-binding forkhead associated (FHA) protein
MWILRTITDQPERTFRLTQGAIRSIGRATGADFILDAALVSRVHCRLTVTGDGGLEVTDLESTNGTYVNGAKVAAARLADGDTLRVGRVELLVGRAAE